jgi:hypothetical protein
LGRRGARRGTRRNDGLWLLGGGGVRGFACKLVKSVPKAYNCTVSNICSITHHRTSLYCGTLHSSIHSVCPLVSTPHPAHRLHCASCCYTSGCGCHVATRGRLLRQIGSRSVTAQRARHIAHPVTWRHSSTAAATAAIANNSTTTAATASTSHPRPPPPPPLRLPPRPTLPPSPRPSPLPPPAAARRGLSTVPSEADVVVIGGGSIGASTLYHLAERGINAVMVEKDQLTAGTTWHSAGLLWRLRPADTDIELIDHTRHV